MLYQVQQQPSSLTQSDLFELKHSDGMKNEVNGNSKNFKHKKNKLIFN